MHLQDKPIELSVHSEAELCAWIGDSVPGQRIIYHAGFLIADLARLAASPTKRKRLQSLARRALWAQEMGLVHLVQRRLGDGEYAYIAIRRPAPSHRIRGASIRVVGRGGGALAAAPKDC